MNKVTLHDAFVGHGCEGRVAPVKAVSAEAGAMWIDLYHAVTTEAGRYVQGGGCTTVGVAGLVQSGGFGSFSKGFGTAAAGLLEAEVVTATARCAPPMPAPTRISSGRSKAVAVEASASSRGSRFVLIPCRSSSALPEVQSARNRTPRFRTLIQRFFEFYRDKLFNPHWGEQIRIRPDNVLELSMVCQGLDDGEVTRVWQPFFDWVQDSSGTQDDRRERGRETGTILVGCRGAEEARQHRNDQRPSLPTRRSLMPRWSGDQDQVGALLHGYESLWLPAKLLQGDEQVGLVNALFAASRIKKVELHFNKGIAGAPAEAVARTRDTATNPAVVDAFVSVIIADGERPSVSGSGAACDGHRRRPQQQASD
jgi:FAD/FMN-containing dehydrogenase